MSKKRIDFNIWHILSNKSERTILLVCIGIAFVFWIFSKLSKSYETDITVALDFVPPSENNILTTPPPPNLDVTLKGNGWALMSQTLFQKPFKLTYKLEETAFQALRLQLLTRDLKKNLRSSINIGTITPELISLNLDVKASKRIPIELVQNLNIAPQYIEIAPQNIYPDTINVVGPVSVIREIKSWKTITLQANNIRTRIQDTIAIAPYSNPQVTFEPSFVGYDIIVEQITEKTIDIPLMFIGKIDDNAILSATSVQAKCTIGLSFYDKLTPDLFALVVDLNAVKDGIVPIKFQKTPTFLQNVEYSTKTVQYLVIND